MRGIHALGEALGPQFVCPSCAHRLLVGQTPATASAALRRSAGNDFGSAINSANAAQRRRIETSSAQSAPSDEPEQQPSSESNNAAASQQLPSRKKGLFGFKRWHAPGPTVGGPSPEIKKQAQQNTSGQSRPPAVDIHSRKRAGPLPVFEKRSLASLRRADLVSLLGEYTSDKNENIYELFEEGKPDMVMHAFLGPEKYRKAVYNLPGASFAEAFRLLHPDFFIEPYKRVHRYFHPNVVSGKGFRGMKAVFNDFERMLFQVIQLRQQAGHAIGIAEFTHLLRCASAMGHAKMAEDVWIEMHTRGLTPTTECYNHLMSAKVWDQAYFDKEKFNVRVTEWNLRKRSFKPANVNYRGYKTGPDGLRDEIVALFNRMIAEGIPPDEETFIHVMIASARVGDMQNVKKILKGVWNVNVDVLVTHGEDPNRLSVRPFATSSPLHPTTKLFFAIAHIFGSNNDFPTALQLVDYLSRQYDIYIDRSTWQELLEWSFVLSLRRFHDRADENSVGLIPRATVKDIYQTMTTTPYNCTPNMVMINIMVKQSFIRNVFDETLGFMNDGYKLFIRTMRKRNRLLRTLLRHQLNIAPMPTKSERKAWERKEKEYLEVLEQRLALKQAEEAEKDQEMLEELELEDEAKTSIDQYNKESISEVTQVTETASVESSASSLDASSPSKVDLSAIETGTPDSEAKQQQQPPSGEMTATSSSLPSESIVQQIPEQNPTQVSANLQDNQQNPQEQERETDLQNAPSSAAAEAAATTSNTTTTSADETSHELKISLNYGGDNDFLPTSESITATSTATATGTGTGTETATPPTTTTTTTTGTSTHQATVRDRIRTILEEYRAKHNLPTPVNPVQGFGFDLVFENLTTGSPPDATTADLRASERRRKGREERYAAAVNAGYSHGFPYLSRDNESTSAPEEVERYGDGFERRYIRTSRFDPDAVMEYNYLQSHSRSSITHPETGQPLYLRYYKTGHLSLTSIKAFRHIQATTHLAQRELARDVSLIERWGGYFPDSLRDGGRLWLGRRVIS
ncbi:hypothetical protein AAP_01914 [Ascosphaera apis ARSEF 7405]|uniref:Pentatricopeptide repeat protein n=1 Tax=Ascosphaera apis ARSEF 7405 TaxID=392613 RepID=A0A168B0F9_9EURO|nr:hypothetical protein AAP_01914 [Ascosphaera apis ARSEF 7405]